MIDPSLLISIQLRPAAEIRSLTAAAATQIGALAPMLRAQPHADVVAVGIAHRHFEVEPNRVVAWISRGGSLELRSVDPVSVDLVPVTWTVANGATVATEYASTDLLSPRLIRSSTSPAFAHLRGRLLGRLQQRSAQPTYVVTITPRVFKEFFFGGQMRAGAQQTFVETEDQSGTFTSLVPAASMATGLARGEAVPTTWEFRQNRMQLAIICRCIR